MRQRVFGDWSNADLAGAIQHILERDVTRLIERNVPSIDGQPICLAGGVFANVKLNLLVKQMGFGAIFVQPAMSDCGLAVGAPLQALGERGALRPYRLEHVYLGPEFSEAEMERAIRDAGLVAHRHDPVEPVIAAPAGRRPRGGPLQRPHGVRAALARQPLDPLPRERRLGERLAEQAPRAHRVHALRARDPARGRRPDCYVDLAGAEHTWSS